MQGYDLPEADARAKEIINRGYDQSNIVTIEKAKTEILATLDTCIEALSAHCGPKSRYSMIVSTAGAGFDFQPASFTRDGISILEKISFQSPLERHIQNMLNYVGKRVDSSAKDGTTTAMLTAAIFLRKVVSGETAIFTEEDTVYQATQLFSHVVEQILENLEDSTYTLDELLGDMEGEPTESDYMGVAGRVAYYQALSSSGGNVELAEAMKEIFSNSPRCTWDQMEWRSSTRESTAEFGVIVDDFEHRIQCVVGSLSTNMNHALGSEFICENAKVLVCPEELVDQSFEADAVANFIQSLSTSGSTTPHLIIAPRFGSWVTSAVAASTAPVHLWAYSDTRKSGGKSFNWELPVLCARAGVTAYGKNGFTVTDDNIFEVQKAHWQDGYLKFYGFIANVEGKKVHPMYEYPETATPYFTEVRTMIETQVNAFEDGAISNVDLGNEFRSALNRLATVHRPILCMGGPAHEQVANADVVRDVQGAIMSSLKYGFHINGVMSFVKAVSLEEDEVGLTKEVKIMNLLQEAAEEVASLVYDETAADANFNRAWDKDDYSNCLGRFGAIEPFSFKKALALPDSQLSGMSTTYPVLQPALVYREILKRLKELHLKFILTEKIVMIGGVMVKEDKKE